MTQQPQQSDNEAPIKKGCVKNNPGPVKLKFMKYLTEPRARLRIAGSRRDGLFKKAQTLESMTHCTVVVMVMPQPGDGPVSLYCRDGSLDEAVQRFTALRDQEQTAAAEVVLQEQLISPAAETNSSPAIRRRPAQPSRQSAAKRRKLTTPAAMALEATGGELLALTGAADDAIEFDFSFAVVDLASRRHHWFSAPIYQVLKE